MTGVQIGAVVAEVVIKTRPTMVVQDHLRGVKLLKVGAAMYRLGSRTIGLGMIDDDNQ
jgi:hypothetical protein